MAPLVLWAQADLQYQALTHTYSGHTGTQLTQNFVVSRHGQLITRQSELPAIYRSGNISLASYLGDYLSLSLEVVHNAAHPQAFSVSVEFLDVHENWSTPQALLHCPTWLNDTLADTWLSQPLEVPEDVMGFRYTLSVAARTIEAPPMVFQPSQVHLSRIEDMPAPATQPQRYRLSGDESNDCGHPGFLDRSAWYAPDPDTQAHSCLSPQYAPVTHAVVTESHTANQSRNWAAQVLALWSFQVNVLQQCDMGYNWLIDPNGVIYEGRGGGMGVVGNYLCGDEKAEVGTSGICLLGTFANQNPTAAQQASLERLLAWQMAQSSLRGDEVHSMLGGQGKVSVITEATSLCGADCGAAPLSLVDASLRQRVQTQVDQCLNATSLSSFDSPVELKVFPNPNPGRFQVVIRGQRARTVYLRLLNLQGQALFQQQYQLLPGEQTLDLALSSLPTGLYYLHAMDEKEVHSCVVRVEN